MSSALKGALGKRSRPLLLSLRIGIVCLFFGLLVGTLSCAPLKGKPASPPESDTFGLDLANTKAIQEKANEFHSRYTGVMDDVLNLQIDPNYEKAEEQRQKLEAEANLLATKFQELANKLQSKMDNSAQRKTIGSSIMDTNSFKEKADQFRERYTGLLDDILSHQQDADYDKIEGKRQKIVAEANLLASQYRELAKSLEGKLDKSGQEKTVSPLAADTIGFDLFNTKTIQGKADEFYSRYTGVVDDMLSTEKDPDYQKAEEKRQKFVAEAESLASKFQKLADRLRGALGKLNANAIEKDKLPAK